MSTGVPPDVEPAPPPVLNVGPFAPEIASHENSTREKMLIPIEVFSSIGPAFLSAEKFCKRRYSSSDA